MATKKSASKKKATTTSRVKKAPAKARVTTKTKVKKASSSSAASARSMKLEKDTRAFMSATITRETIYWIVFGAVSIAFALWVTQLQSDINKLYDDIDAASQHEVTTPAENAEDNTPVDEE